MKIQHKILLAAGVSLAFFQTTGVFAEEGRILLTESQNPTPRIVGGIVSPDHAYPWLVALENNTGFQFCAGTLITADKVLTAAHCSNIFNTKSLKVRIDSNLRETGGKLFDVLAQKVHPKWNPVTYDYDVAVWTLRVSTNSPMTLSDAVNLVELPEACASLDCLTGLANPGTTVRTTGWGNTSVDGAPSDVLLDVDVPIVSNATCNEGSSYANSITNRMMCAGLQAGGKDSCQGDSGGPLFAYIPEARAGLQTGIVSFGDGCAAPNKYGVYTRISNPEIRAFIRREAKI